MSTGSSLGRWLMRSDDRPPDYDEVDSPPTYLEATRGPYCWIRNSMGRDSPMISSDNLEDWRDSIVHF